MKKTVTHLIILMVLVIASAGSPGFARGLLGTRYFDFSVGQIKPGDSDIKDIDNSIPAYAAGLNIPVHPNIDVAFGLSHSRLAGTDMLIDYDGTSWGISGGINYIFLPDEKIIPYGGIRIGFVSMESEAKNWWGQKLSDQDDEIAINITSGLEFNVSEPLAVYPSFTYRLMSNNNDIFAGLGLSWWFNEFLFGTLSASYTLDEKDLSYFAGLGFAF